MSRSRMPRVPPRRLAKAESRLDKLGGLQAGWGVGMQPKPRICDRVSDGCIGLPFPGLCLCMYVCIVLRLQGCVIISLLKRMAGWPFDVDAGNDAPSLTRLTRCGKGNDPICLEDLPSDTSALTIFQPVWIIRVSEKGMSRKGGKEGMIGLLPAEAAGGDYHPFAFSAASWPSFVSVIAKVLSLYIASAL